MPPSLVAILGAPGPTSYSPSRAPTPAAQPSGGASCVAKAASDTGKAVVVFGDALLEMATHPGRTLKNFLLESIDPFIHPVATCRSLREAWRKTPIEGLTQTVQVLTGMATTVALVAWGGAALGAWALGTAAIAGTTVAGTTLGTLAVGLRGLSSGSGLLMTAMNDASIASVGASALSLAKHEVDAARATTPAQTSLAESRLADDLFNIGMYAATYKITDPGANSGEAVAQNIVQAAKDQMVNRVGNVDRFVSSQGLASALARPGGHAATRAGSQVARSVARDRSN